MNKKHFIIFAILAAGLFFYGAAKAECGPSACEIEIAPVEPEATAELEEFDDAAEAETKPPCAGEGETTSGTVAPVYNYDCCQGLESLDHHPEPLMGAGLLCYDPAKGLPVCLNNETEEEGWYYPGGELLLLKECDLAEKPAEPMACTMEYAPVCGLDGETYSNDCHAAAAGVTVRFRGECDFEHMVCTDEYEPVCGEDGRTYPNRCIAGEKFGVEVSSEGSCREQVFCHELYDPVCGADGQTYSNRCVAEEQNNVEVAYEGECRTEPQNPELEGCLTWYDGCNQCRVEDGRLTACTERYCLQQDIPYCLKYEYLPPQKLFFSGVKYECDNGQAGELGPLADCRSQSYWRQYAQRACDRVCGSEDDCGVREVEMIESCRPEVYKQQLSDARQEELQQIRERARLLKNNQTDELLFLRRQQRNRISEEEVVTKHLRKMQPRLERLSEQEQEALKIFVAYGVDDDTAALGEGERAAVIYSYADAYGELPQTEEHYEDMIKIANGRFPSRQSLAAEKEAERQFAKIYHRAPDMENQNDRAAITVMAYGLRQQAGNRNLESERQGIATFRHIYGWHPKEAEAHGMSETNAWNIMQAITYSGASR